MFNIDLQSSSAPIVVDSVNDTSITSNSAASISIVSSLYYPYPDCGGCLVNAACTYETGASTGADTKNEPSSNITQEIASILVPSYSISSIVIISGQCLTTFGSAVTLGTGALTLDVRSSLDDASLSQSAASAIRDYLGFTDCFCNAIIVTPSPSLISTATASLGHSGLNQSSPTSSIPIGSIPTPTTATTTTPKGRSVRVIVSVTLSVLSFLAVTSGVLLVLRHRKKARLMEKDSNEQGSPETQTSQFFQKPELDAEQRRHEMGAEKERCELDGQSSRQEMNAQEVDEPRRTVPQELRGIEPSHEMEAEQKDSVVAA